MLLADFLGADRWGRGALLRTGGAGGCRVVSRGSMGAEVPSGSLEECTRKFDVHILGTDAEVCMDILRGDRWKSVVVELCLARSWD